jgi:hypothetical protein
MDANFSNSKDDRGRIFVNEYFQVTTQNPLKPAVRGAEVYQNIFCYGDACLSMMDEPKCIPAIKQTQPIVAQNIKAVAYGGKTVSMPLAINLYAGIYFGYKAGCLVLNDVTVKMKNQLAEKEKIESAYMLYFSNRSGGKCKWCMNRTQMCMLPCCGSYCCCCTGCHNKKAKRERREKLRELLNEHKAEK